MDQQVNMQGFQLRHIK